MSLGKLFTTTGGTKFRTFGTLEKVIVDDWGVHIYNQDGWSVGMKKVYMYWAHIAQKAERAIGKSVVIETGSSSSSSDYFRDLYVDNPTILDFPEDAGPEAQSALVWARAHREEIGYQLYLAKEQNNELNVKWEELTASQKGEAETASLALDAVWDDFKADPNRRFMLVGAAYLNRDKPEKPDKAFALRLGLDTTKHKRINVKVLERTYRNNLLVELPDFGDTKCQIAVKQGNAQNTKNEWCIVTVSNTLKGWEPLEDELYSDWRSTRRDITYYMDAHNTLMGRLFAEVA